MFIAVVRSFPSPLNVLKHLSILKTFPRMKGAYFGCVSTDMRRPFKNDQVELLSLFTSAFEPHNGKALDNLFVHIIIHFSSRYTQWAFIIGGCK